jgi:hypothetical protein
MQSASAHNECIVDSGCLMCALMLCVSMTASHFIITSRRINYWTQFVENHTVPEISSAHIFVVGSHFDKIQEKGPKVATIESYVRSRLKSSPLTLNGYFPIDCR